MRPLDVFKSLSDLTRARIVHLLLHRGPEMCVCNIVSTLGLPQSTVSRQLMMLRYVGLVKDRREGVWMHYSLSPATTAAHKLALRLISEGFTEETMFAEDIERFDQLENCKYPIIASAGNGCNTKPKRTTAPARGTSR